MLKQDSGQRRDSTDQQRLICAGVHSPAGLPSSWWYHRAVVEGVSIKIQLRHPNCRKCYARAGPAQGGGRGGRGRGEGATREGGETGNRGDQKGGNLPAEYGVLAKTSWQVGPERNGTQRSSILRFHGDGATRRLLFQVGGRCKEGIWLRSRRRNIYQGAALLQPAGGC